MTDREEVPHRRYGLRAPVAFIDFVGNEVEYLVQFNFSERGRVIECFVCQDGAKITKTGSQIRALLEDGCKAVSRLLQYGDSMDTLAGYFGEDRPEGAESGPPSSVIGAIARVGADLDARGAEAMK